jgi:hypothetical protein
MLILSSHPEGDGFLRFIGRPWIRTSIGPDAYGKYRDAIEDCVFMVGDLARPRNAGEVLLRFKVVDKCLVVRAVVSKELIGTDVEYTLGRLAWYVERTWNKQEALNGAK